MWRGKMMNDLLRRWRGKLWRRRRRFRRVV
jgi:hypothetical protein